MKVLLRILGTIFLLAIVCATVFFFDPNGVNDQLIRYHLWRADVRSEYVVANGHRLHYFEATPPDGSAGIPLLLIHGLGARGEDWSAMIPTLSAKGFHVYAPDLLGYGRSDKPDASYSIALEESVVADFMRAIHLSRADVGGWSMGGWVAAKLALDHPAQVDRLVLYDSAGVTYTPSFTRDLFVPTDAASIDRLLAILTPHPRPLPGFAVAPTLRRIKQGGWIIQRSMDAMLSGADLLDTRLASITQPTLIVWGAEDRLIPISVGEMMHREIPHSSLVGISGCGHLAPSECAQPVLDATIEFLKAEPAIQGEEKTMRGAP